MDEPSWKKFKLSLERPYKNDNGEYLPVLLDITTQGEHIYEPKDDPSNSLGEKLRRVFLERGPDFFETRLSLNTGVVEKQEFVEDDSSEISQKRDLSLEHSTLAMTPEELYKMRSELMPQLHVALGEIGLARELLSSLLSAMGPTAAISDSSVPLTATMVTKPAPISSIHAFDTQLSIGGKDEALRKAADLFKSAAEDMERGRIKGEKYWEDALKIRRSNWGLIPAPLPYGSATGKGADKTSKDFLVSFGLEESPSLFRRQAIGYMATHDTSPDTLIFPHRHRTRLRVSLLTSDSHGIRAFTHNTIRVMESVSLDGSLKAAQEEIVEQEIFSVLIREASTLPTASARVSERLIVIDLALGLELRFELVTSEIIESGTFDSDSANEVASAKCDLIYSVLHTLLLRMHSHHKTQRLGSSGVIHLPGPTNITPPPPMLQPIIGMLQYQLFCQRVKAEIDKMDDALTKAGIASVLRFGGVGESGRELLQLLYEDSGWTVAGEVVLRVANRHTLRFTLVSPLSLTAHLCQATVAVPSIPQLTQLLSNEIERCLLSVICDLGKSICNRVNGTWFVDQVKGRSVGRWEGCVVNFQISFRDNFSLCCTALRSDRDGSKGGTLLEMYIPERDVSLTTWVQEIIHRAISRP